ncbi:MAG: DUF1501 domain-containing protein [Fimbriimonadaceae bacterium]|nr:DUF1501 domain-containing protein [Fimbriimonadaceae bacterium]
MALIEANGCSEYRSLSRRSLLKQGGAMAALATLAPAWLPKVAYAAADDSDRDIVVSVYLRGGADGLTLCVPHGDAAYYSQRPGLAIAPPGAGSSAATDLDGFFGLPPALSPLAPVYAAGHLSFVHATGLTSTSRSHFDAQRWMEVGNVGVTTNISGWLGRHLATVSPMDSNAVLRGVSLGSAMAVTMIGAPLTLPIQDPGAFGLSGTPSSTDERSQVLLDLYADETALRATVQNTMNTIALLEAIDFAGYSPAGGASYPASTFGQALEATAALVRANVGVEAVHVDKNGWDTHAGQGVLGGTMALLMEDLAAGLLAFYTDMNASGHIGRVIVVVLTEFGRVVAENGSMGTDHGHGGALMLMGGGVNGGQVIRNWPGLQTEQLFEQRDLAITIDYRDILAEIVLKRLHNTNLGSVFPGYVPTFRNAVAG